MTINLKGIAVGNGVTDFTIDVEPSQPDTYYNLGVIDKELYSKLTDNGCFRSFRSVIPPVSTITCDEAWAEFEVKTSKLNVYDLFRHTYGGALSLTEAERYDTVELNGETHSYRRGFTMQEYTPWMRQSNA
mmetsp:Transcript_30407/g.29762  ORF Transcript_30407/g.29762 Transcript_30407/m.29762 type:complete len:131 (-) Transcript_30407:462-854(-)